MSEIRDFLELKVRVGPREWLVREPRGTHPAILALVREAQGTGLFYDDDVERYVNEHAGDLPAHERHGTEGRHPVVTQLGHEVYIAKEVISDAVASAKIAGLIEDGYARPTPSIPEGRYTLRAGTCYVGRSIPDFGPERRVRIESYGEGLGFIPKGCRTAYRMPEHALIRKGW